MAYPPFRSIKLRSRRKTCPACGDEGEKLGAILELDYISFCGGPRPDWVSKGLEDKDRRKRMTAKVRHKRFSVSSLSQQIVYNRSLGQYKELKERIDSSNNPVRLIDVRSSVEFGICHLPNSTSACLRDILQDEISCFLPLY